MTDPDTISADYTLRPSELAATLALLVEARQPTLVWGPPGTAKSMIAQQVAADAGRRYVDVRALLLDPVDLRGIPWRDSSDRTRWAPPAFLPPTDDPGRWLINLEELPSAVQMVQAALYQLVLDRMHQAASLAKAQGKLPGGVEETVRGAHASTVDWRTLLRRYMTDAVKSDYSWSLPNRRFIDSGLYLPSIRSEGIDTIAVIVDTSGSLPAGTLAEFWAEVREIATELQPERVILLQVDAAVQDATEYAASDLPDEIAITVKGQLAFEPQARPELEATVARLDIDFAQHVRPTAAMLWSRVAKGRILDIARSVLSPAWASARSKNKKPDLAKAMEQAFAAGDPPLGLNADMHAAALAWVPPRLRGLRHRPRRLRAGRRGGGGTRAGGGRLRSGAGRRGGQTRRGSLQRQRTCRTGRTANRSLRRR